MIIHTTRFKMECLYVGVLFRWQMEPIAVYQEMRTGVGILQLNYGQDKIMLIGVKMEISRPKSAHV